MALHNPPVVHSAIIYDDDDDIANNTGNFENSETLTVDIYGVG